MHAAQSIIHINLLPAEGQAMASRFAPTRTMVIVLFMLASAFSLIAVVGFIQALQVSSLRAEIDQLHMAARESRSLIQRINALTTEREAVRGRLAVIEQLDQDRFVRVRLADELARRIPEQVWLTSFKEAEDQIIITGVTFSNLSVADFISRLEHSTLYEKVDLAVSRRGVIDSHEVVNFTITARRQAVAGPPANTTG
jgi:type IV pilus assembly protein PilN